MKRTAFTQRPSKQALVTQEVLREWLSYDPETGDFTWLKGRRKGLVAGCPDAYGYCQMGFLGRPFTAHRLAWFYVHGTWPEEIDHKDQNRYNNRIANLRDVPRRVNCENRAPTSSSSATGYTGIGHSGFGTFNATIQARGRKFYLGTFKTIEEAIQARIEGKRKHHPEAVT